MIKALILGERRDRQKLRRLLADRNGEAAWGYLEHRVRRDVTLKLTSMWLSVLKQGPSSCV